MNKTVLAAIFAAVAYLGAGLFGVNSQANIMAGETPIRGDFLQIVLAAAASALPWLADKFKGLKKFIPGLPDSKKVTFTKMMGGWEVLNHSLKGNLQAESLLDDLLQEIAKKCRECEDEPAKA